MFARAARAGAGAMDLGLRETDLWVQPRAAIAAWNLESEEVLAVGKALAITPSANKTRLL